MTASIYFGAEDCVLSRYTLGTNKDIEIRNTDSTGDIIHQLGADTSATKVIVKNLNGTERFSVDATGLATITKYTVSGTGTHTSGDVYHNDGVISIWGDGSDLQVSHQGGTNLIYGAEGLIRLQAKADSTNDINIMLGNSASSSQFYVTDRSNNTLFAVRGDGSFVGLDIDALSDTTIISAANNDVLVYQTVPGKWNNMPYRLSYLFDVNTTGIANNKILKYDSGTSKWVMADESGGSVSILQFDLDWVSGSETGSDVTIGGNNGTFTNLLNSINLGSTSVNTDFSWNSGSGILTYTSAATVKVMINANTMLAASDNNNTHLTTRLTVNGTTQRQQQGRVSKDTAGTTPFNIVKTMSLSQNDVIEYRANCTGTNSNNYTLSVHSMQIVIYGVN